MFSFQTYIESGKTVKTLVFKKVRETLENPDSFLVNLLEWRKSQRVFSTSSLGKKCPDSEFFWSVFSRIRIEYGEMRSISPYSFQMRDNTDQKYFEYGHFSQSTLCKFQNCFCGPENSSVADQTSRFACNTRVIVDASSSPPVSLMSNSCNKT